ncbi:MAG: hypothetical protein OXQ31_10025 [Spirochaetaceae bacterium]|nr:hypothetical protein [Spirochaetaceae bacterium]
MSVGTSHSAPIWYVTNPSFTATLPAARSRSRTVAEEARRVHALGRAQDVGRQLNVCPSSNVMLGAVSSLVSHPVRVLVDHGVDVTLNTDDPMSFGQSVSQEYLNLYDAGVFSSDELDAIRVAALRV